MLIGQATLKSAAFCSRLTLLLEDLGAAGYTVWLEGLSVRFDRADDQECIEPNGLGTLMEHYRDIVEWVPEPRAELAELTWQLARAQQTTTTPRWQPFFGRRGYAVKAHS